MSNCQAAKRPVLKAYDYELGKVYLFQPRCKMWKCVPCAHQNRLLWQAKIGNGFEVYYAAGKRDWCFVTLTSHQKLTTESQCLYVWRSAWAKLSARIRRKYPGCHYVLIPEHHENGRVHWHMLMDVPVDYAWLKKSATACGLGWVTDCQSVYESIGAILYVAKYLGKGIGDNKWPKNLRRIGTSQRWPILPDLYEEHVNKELVWSYWMSYFPEGLDYIAHELEQSSGMSVMIIR